MNSRNTILDAASLIEPASNPKVEHKSRGFLRELNSGGATPLEQLSPKEARDLLAAPQASAPHNGASRGTGSNSSFVRIVPLQPLKLRHGQYLPLRQSDRRILLTSHGVVAICSSSSAQPLSPAQPFSSERWPRPLPRTRLRLVMSVLHRVRSPLLPR